MALAANLSEQAVLAFGNLHDLLGGGKLVRVLIVLQRGPAQCRGSRRCNFPGQVVVQLGSDMCKLYTIRLLEDCI